MADYCEHCGAVKDDESVEVVFGDFTVSADRRSVYTLSERSPLTAKEADILLALIERARKGQYASKEMLLMRFFEESDFDKGLDVYTHRIRQKLLAIGTKSKIETIWGQGLSITEAQSAIGQYGDFQVDRERSLLIRERRSNHLRPGTLALLELLVANKFVSFVDGVAKLYGDKKSGPQALRREIMFLREALKNVGSTVSIVTSNARNVGDFAGGYWLKSRATDIDATKVKGPKGMVQGITPRQKQLLEIWQKYPLLSFADLGGMMSINATTVWRFAKQLERKGLVDDILSQRKDFEDRVLTPTQQYFWNVVRENPNVPKLKLAEIAGWKSAAAYKMIDCLKAKGFLEEPPRTRFALVAVDPHEPKETSVQ